MVCRALLVCSVLFVCSQYAPSQVFKCDFGPPPARMVVNAYIFRSPIKLPDHDQRALKVRLVSLGTIINSEAAAEAFLQQAETLVAESYQNRGYFKASATAEFRRITVRGNVQVVNLVFHVEPGRLYRLAGITALAATRGRLRS